MDRVIGCLLGGAIGDSLGTLCEFDDSHTATHKVEQYITTNGQLSLCGHNVELSITDDTELCMALARSLVRKGRYDVCDVSQSYTTWFYSNPFDVGIATTKALGKTSLKYDSQSNYQIIKSCSQKYNYHSLSNGCLMRISPVGIMGLNMNDNDLCKIGCIDCQLTNPHPMAQEATMVYIRAIKAGIITGEFGAVMKYVIDPMDNRSVIKNFITRAIHNTNNSKIPIYKDGEIVYTTSDSVFQGHLGIALYDTFHELSHTSDFSDIMKNIMCRGGDTDTNCAITGALYGAIYGYHKIPDHLITELLSRPYKRKNIYPWGDVSDIVTLAHDLVRVGGT